MNGFSFSWISVFAWCFLLLIPGRAEGTVNSTGEPIVIAPSRSLPLPKVVEETSGLLWWDNLLWTFNDSGGKPVLYAIDPETGSILREVTIKNATNQDWEDIADDDEYIYIGDFGNNMGKRKELQIYRVRKEEITPIHVTEVLADTIAFAFEDQVIHPLASFKRSAFDCEAMITLGDSLYLFTKNWEDYTSTMYSLPKIPGKWVAQRMALFESNGLITAADYNLNTRTLFLLGYIGFYPFIWVIDEFNPARFPLTGATRYVPSRLEAIQTEGLAVDNQGRVWVSAEGMGKIPYLYLFESLKP
jgi:hypothetical protein